MVDRVRSTLASGLGLLLLSGCYSGLDRINGGPEGVGGSIGGGADDGAEGGAADDDDDDDDDDIPTDAQCEWSDTSPSLPIRRLTQSEYNNAIRDLFGLDTAPADAFVEDAPSAGFAANTIAISELQTRMYIDAAETIAADVVASGMPLADCDLGANATCPDTFIATQGRRIFRRDLSAEELADYRSLFDDTRMENSVDVATEQVLAAMLASPSFLYLARRPLAQGNKLAAYTLASRLSFFLWSTMPDDALLDAAAAGDLDELEDVESQVRAMLDDPRAAATLATFHAQWLHTEVLEIATPSKDAELFPAWSDELANAMSHELTALAQDVILDGDGTVASLLQSRRAWVDDELAALYGVEAPAGGEGWVELPEGERAGLLTRAGFLATHAHQQETSVVKRGAVVQTKLLCGNLPLPPDDLDLDPSIDRLESEACRGCHEMIDPIGKGLESYDAIGQWSDVVSDGQVVGLPAPTFSGGAELSALLADSPQVERCVARQWFQFAHRREASPDDSCAMELINDAMNDSGGDIREAIVAVATSDSFRFGIDG